MEPMTTEQPKTSPRRNERTCVGCGRRDTPGHLVRVLLADDGTVIVDLRGGMEGRGAHVHPASDCIGKAAKRGLGRSFRRAVPVEARVLAAAIVQAAHVRLDELMTLAFASGLVVAERDQLVEELSRDALSTVVVAADAPQDTLHGEPGRAVLQGRAVAWGTCASLGAFGRRGPVAMLGIRSSKLGDAIAQACRVADGARTGAEVR